MYGTRNGTICGIAQSPTLHAKHSEKNQVLVVCTGPEIRPGRRPKSVLASVRHFLGLAEVIAVEPVLNLICKAVTATTQFALRMAATDARSYLACSWFQHNAAALFAGAPR